MPDLSGLAEALRRGFGEIPPAVIAIALLAGPTAVLVGFRFLNASRRLQGADALGAAPYWVCADCRSINELRQSRCYHCHQEPAKQGDLEVIVEQPAGVPGYAGLPGAQIPATAMFAAASAALPAGEPSVGVPVIAHSPGDAVAVGPGHLPDADLAQPADLGLGSTPDELAPATQTLT